MNLSSSYSDIFNNNSLILSHPRNASTSPKKTQLKDQIIQQLSTLISLELNKIDSRDIETKFSIYFNLNENDEAYTYVQSLCSKISETKKVINNKLKNFLNHNINALIDNINEQNNNLSIINNFSSNSDNDLSLKNKFKSILKEIKVLNNNSRIKFKKLYDNLSNEYDKILSTIYDYIQKGNTKLIIDRLNRVEQLKNDVLFDVTSIENIQNKFTDSIKSIININGNDKLNENKNDKHTLNRTKTGYFTFHKNNNKSLNIDLNYTKNDLNLYSKLNKNKFDVSNFNTYGNNVHTISGKDVYKNYHMNNKDENECVKVYILKLKEKKNEIEKLKQQLLQEKENKTKVINELNKLQFFNKMSLSIKNSQKNLTQTEKFNKLIEMIIGFTYSMNTLRNNLYQKTISHMDAKNIYGKLKTKLIALIDELPSLKNDLLNTKDKDEDLNDENNIEKNTDIKTIKEENEYSQIFTDREKDFNKNNFSNQKQTGGNIVNNNITLNTLPNYNMQILLEENKNLNNQKEQEKNLIESFKNQISELKKIIMEKDKELEEERNNSIKTQKEELSNIINNNIKNIEQLKTTYQILIDDKDNRIKELEEEIISYEKEIDKIKEENDKLKNECRKDKILSEAEVNNLKNQKIELQCLLEHGSSNNSLINLNNKDEKVKKMENELNIKNKQIILLTQNHENDLKELNLSIEMLKQKILQLEQENTSLTKTKNKEKINE